MVFMSCVLLFPAEPTLAGPGTMNYTVLVMGGVTLLSTAYYYFPVYGGIHWFKGPVVTNTQSGGVSGVGSISEIDSTEKND